MEAAANSPRIAAEPMPINANLPRIWLRLLVKVAGRPDVNEGRRGAGGSREGVKRERVVACLLSPSECGTDSGYGSGARLRLSDSLTGMRCSSAWAHLPVPPTCHSSSSSNSRHCPLPSWNSNLSVAGTAWPGMAGRFAAALREIGYQSFCNLVCNLKFMKHIPLTQKMQANV